MCGMAEYYLQQGLDNLADGYEEWGYGDEGGYGGYGPRPKTCRRCRTSNLWWSLSGDKWRLIDSAGNRHVCPNQSAREAFK